MRRVSSDVLGVGVERQLLADEVRALRAGRGYSQDELARRIGFSQSTIKNIETAYRMPTKEQARLLDEALDTAGVLTRWESRIRAAPISPGFRPFAVVEAEARALKTFEHTVVPGLFQTKEYAQALVEVYPGLTEEETAARVAVKLERQSVLELEDPPWFWAVVDESVLHRPIGSAAVMAAQLSKLTEFARRPRICVQVLSAAHPHPAMGGSFVIADLARQPAVAYVETVLDGQTVYDRAMVEMVGVVWEAIRTKALPDNESLTLIEEGAQRWQQRIAS